VVDDILAIDRSIDTWEGLQRLYCRLYEEGHEAEANLMFLLELIPVPCPQVIHRLQIHFVESGQYGRIALRFQQTLRNACAQPGHGHALLRPLTLHARLGDLRLRRDDGGGLLFFRFFSFPGVQVGGDIRLQNPAVLAGSPDRAGVDLHRFRQTPNRRSENRLLCLGSGFTRHRFGGHRYRFNCRFGRLGACLGSRGRSSSLARLDQTQQVACLHRGAGRCRDLSKYAVHSGGDLEDHLVGFQIDNGFITAYRFSRLLVPGEDGGVGDGFRQGGNIYLGAHYSGVLRFIDGLMRPVSASSINTSCCCT